MIEKLTFKDVIKIENKFLEKIAAEMVSEKNISYTAATEMVKRFRDE